MELLIALALITVVGHGIWVLVARIVRALTRGRSESPPPAPGAGDRSDPVAAELADLDATERQLQRFLTSGVLDGAAFEERRHEILGRRRVLLRSATVPEAPPPAPAIPTAPPVRVPTAEPAPPAPAAPPRAASPRERLEQLLTATPSVLALARYDRERALGWHDALAKSELAALSPPAQLALARLLMSARRIGNAIAAYQRWLEASPPDARFAEVALEAGRFAAEAGRGSEARSFLRQARDAALPADGRREADDLLRSLEAPPAVAVAPPATRRVPTEPAVPTVEPRLSRRPAPAATARPGAVEPVAPPPPPRRSMRELLVAFMEERHILWGELVGGLLIVGCSIALVVSLRQTLEQIPYFPFFILAGVTAAAFGVGFYSLRRWRLLATSRGLLVIGTLLVPLCFLALVTLSRGADGRTLEVGLAVGAVALFGWLTSRAARTLAPGLWGPMSLAVLGPSVSQLLSLWFLGVDPPAWLFLALGALPVVCYAAATGGLRGFALHARPDRAPITVESAHTGLGVLGIGTFALAIALAWLVFQSGDIGVALERIAVLVAVAALPIAMEGLRLHHGLAEDPARAAWRTAGTATALAGGTLMLIALALAWPEPRWIVLVSTVNFAALTGIALRGRLPIVQGAALPCLFVGSLTGFHLLRGELAVGREELGRRIVEAFVSARSVGVLLALGALLGAAAARCARAGAREHVVAYAVGSGSAAFLALALVTWHAGSHPLHPPVVYGIVTVALLTRNLTWRRPIVSVGGLLLLAATTLWALRAGLGELTPLWGAVLAAEALLMSGAALGLSRDGVPRALADAYRNPLARCAPGVGVLALVAAVGSWWLARAPSPWFVEHVVTGLCLVVTAGILAWELRSTSLVWVGSALLVGTVAYAQVGELSSARPWFIALLASSTLGLVAGRLRVPDAEARRVFIEPLRRASLAWSLFAVPLLPAMLTGEPVGRLTCLLWLSTIWLAFAWTEQRHWLFSAFQAALTLAAFFGIDARTTGYDPWIRLALLSVLWSMARIALRSHPTARHLLSSRWMTVDRAVLALLVLGQLVAAAGGGTAGLGPWVLLGILGLGALVALWERWGVPEVIGTVVLALTAPVLAAPHFGEEPALRWGLGVSFVIGSAVVWLRAPLSRLGGRLGWRIDEGASLPALARTLLVVGTVLPILGLTTGVVLSSVWGSRPQSIGVIATAVPLVMIVVGLVGHALREVSPGYAFAAGLVATLTVPGSYALRVALTGAPFDGAAAVRLIQLGSATAAAWALVWLASRPWLGTWRETSPSGSPLMTLQLALGLVAQSALLAWSALRLFATPGAVPRDVMQVGAVLGWVGLGLAVAATARARGETRALDIRMVSGAGLALSVMLASAAGHWDRGDWLAYHILTAGSAMTGLAVVAFLWPDTRRLLRGSGASDAVSEASLRRGVTVVSAVLVALAVRGAWDDPARPSWSVAATLMASVLAGSLAIRFRSPSDVYGSGLLLNLAASLVWIAGARRTLVGLAQSQTLCLAIASIVWSCLEATWRTRERPLEWRGPWPPFSHAAAIGALSLAAGVVALGLATDFAPVGSRVDAGGPLGWLAFGATAAAMSLRLWDPTARSVLPALYAAGLIAIGLGLHTARLTPAGLARSAVPALAVYVVLAGALWRAVPRWPGLRPALRLPDRPGGWPHAWLVEAQAGLGIVLAALTVAMALGTGSRADRFVAPVSVGLLALAGVLMASERAGRRQPLIQYATLLFAVLALAETGWAWLDPSTPGIWPARGVLLLVALAAATLGYGVGLGRWGRDATGWAERGRRLGPWLGVQALAVFAIVLLSEGAGAPVAMPFVVLVPVALLALMAASVAFAVMPGLDPLGLSERGRTLYVYAAELMLALMFVHLRLTAPRVFLVALTGRYWPWIVMAVAFAGIGAGEWLRRRRLFVLGDPLAHTGLFLPLLPAVAFWLQPEPNYGRYALLWFVAGLVYTMMAVARRSTGFALVAAAAGNVGLWMVLKYYGVAFLLHPQMWLIPVALTILVAAELNRDRLAPPQLAGVRYLALIGIYVSSTADLFIAGLGNSVVLPLALAVLSVGGVLLGILLRIRAFLFAGTTFLLVVVVSMIWHAAVGRQQTWVLWTSGIVLGAAVLALFAVFEKRRNDVLRVIEEIKGWA